MVRGDHEQVTNFLARWMHKDMEYGLRLAASTGRPVPASAAATQVFQQLLAEGLGEQNVTAVIETLRASSKER
jgi:3-hydroxyisobutyrate dehydrogenase-like beta-hydroxyacid dehydrogenase